MITPLSISEQCCDVQGGICGGKEDTIYSALNMKNPTEVTDQQSPNEQLHDDHDESVEVLIIHGEGSKDHIIYMSSATNPAQCNREV